MNSRRAFLRRVAAATSIICDELGGSVDRFDLMKILYASDRENLEINQRTITGDTYYSVKLGPILSTTLDLAKGGGPADLQVEWDQAFGVAAVSVFKKKGVKVDASALSDDAEALLRKNARKITTMTKEMGVDKTADKLHAEWKEWKNPGSSRLHLPLKEILTNGLEVSADKADCIAVEDSYAKAVAERSVLAKRSIVGA